ncbi:MAG: lipid-A-disaccharide synthase [Deferribacteraceae bacterium]|jgi:lipid-A-disaccharide synthase|nr:lipid-A-disaccharide synthase [Deferribacteraceae bacterium]
MKLFIIAGEPSGDVHAANLVKEIQSQLESAGQSSAVELYGTGGPNLLQLGQLRLSDVQSMAVIGFDAAIKKIPFLLDLSKRLKAQIDLVNPDAIILVDYSGFNLRFAKMLHKSGNTAPVIELVAPQVWIWHYSRVKTLAKCFQKVLCILPFEEKLLRDEGVNAVYIGNPVTDNIKFRHVSKESFAASYSLDPAREIIGLIPGSRPREVASLMPVMMEALRKLKSEGGKLPQFVLAQADAVTDELLAQYLDKTLDITVIKGATPEVMKFSSLLWICSGTATLEAAIIGTPMIIMYQTSRFNEIIAKLITSRRIIGLPNIVAGDKLIVPELLSKDCNGENLAKTHKEMMPNLAQYRTALQTIGELFAGQEPMKNAAREVLATIDEHTKR